MHGVLKEKYFRTASFLEARLGDNRSLTLKSIWELIDEQTKHWNLNLLHEMFPAEEAIVMVWHYNRTVPNTCTLHVNKLGYPDVMVWHYNRTITYIVRSRYKLLCGTWAKMIDHVDGITRDMDEDMARRGTKENPSIYVAGVAWYPTSKS